MIKDKILITPQFTTLQFFASRNVPQILVSSAVYIIVSTFIGGLTFCRKRIDNLPADAGSRIRTDDEVQEKRRELRKRGNRELNG